MDHCDFQYENKITNYIKKNQPKQSRAEYINRESTKHMFVDDLKTLIMSIILSIGLEDIMLVEDP